LNSVPLQVSAGANGIEYLGRLERT
jgi:hypothetical protein